MAADGPKLTERERMLLDALKTAAKRLRNIGDLHGSVWAKGSALEAERTIKATEGQSHG